MPQPLSRVHSSPNVEIYPSAIANSRFASHAIRVIACWAHIEGDLGSLLAQMLQADIATGVAMYQALISSDAKRSALAAAASQALPDWQCLLLRAVQKATKSSREQRNDFAHRVWGVAKEVPDAVLLMPTKIVVDRNVTLRQRHSVDGANVIRPAQLDHSQVMVYKKPDFDEASDRALHAQLLHELLYMVIGRTVEQARRQLLNDPQIQRVLQPLIRESSPLTREILRPPAEGEPPPRGLYPNWDENYYARLDRGEIRSREL